MGTYYNKLNFVKTEVRKYLQEIYKVYGNELLLRLEEYNLLSDPDNCIETSTATGFIMEEFITSKLQIYTKDHDNIHNIKIRKPTGRSTIKLSYDCYAEYDGVLFLINIKVQKKGSYNNAVAAINSLRNDYVNTNPSQEKAYLVLKTNYEFGKSKLDEERKIKIKATDSYFLEEIDFSQGHHQDNRNWSKVFNPDSGRLKVTNAFRKAHSLSPEAVSYQTTFNFLNNINKTS